ncbi:zinc finger CCCH domain-containing protein 39 [Cornus florida]|uniref:zinc finger CCCH domain-containing protein 39 n=1 Tax=Cornus florida TaxID=4283 RepID=UPI0028A0AB46|nr:zinc finger CCCH domain-containing protein 39 [Cornus florida]
MSFSDAPQPPPFMPPPFAGGNMGEFWPQMPVNTEHHPYPYSQFENGPPFKRPRNSVNNNPSNCAPYPPMNPRMNPPNPPVNVGTTHIFYKTRMCLKFSEGNCRNGETCTFAHGVEELRQPPSNWQELVSGKDRGLGNWNDDQRIIHRMKICKKFYNGEECPYGDKCNFLHENPSKFKTDMGKTQESSAITIGTTGPMMGQSSGSDQPDINMLVSPNSDPFRINTKQKPAYWKTKICSKWEATGHCPFMERCHFAHGESELQVLGSRVEAEVMNSWSVPMKPLSAPANDAPPTMTVVSVPTKEEGEDKKCSVKWKGHKKISDIYGDWIDNLTPPHSLPSTVES